MGTFTEPLSGNPLYRSLPGYELTGAYRLHLFDAVHYLDRIRLGIEHGSDNSESSNHYSSVSYFYELDASILLLTDTLDVGDQANESAHDYRAVDSELTGEITSFYEGEDDEVAVTDSGRIVHGESRFRVSVDPLNSGVILRRRYDQHHPRQQARVLVGGVDAGTWYTPESNETLRWAESDFVLPPSLTSGLSNLEILIRSEGASDWTGFYYWVYSIVQ